jgi:hypothetical protein
MSCTQPWAIIGEGLGRRPKAPAGRLKGVMEVSEDVRGEIRNPPSSSDKQISLKYKEHPTAFSFENHHLKIENIIIIFRKSLI